MYFVEKKTTKKIFDRVCNFSYQLTFDEHTLYTLMVSCGYGDCVNDKDCLEFQSKFSGTIIELNEKIVTLNNQLPFIFDATIIKDLSMELQHNMINSGRDVIINNSDKIGW